MKSESKKMLGLCTICILFLASMSVGYAQTESETTTETTVRTKTVDQTESRPTRGPRAGIKGGLNVSNFITDEVNDENPRTGFHIGVYGQLFNSDAFAIQPEVNYSTKGNRVSFHEGIIDQENKFNLNYIDVPVLAVFKLGKTVEIHAGPYWAYMVGANIDTDGDIDDSFYELDRDNFDKWDYGLVGGVGFNFNNLQVGARYNYGLNEIARSEGAKRLLGSNTKNSVGQIYLAINMAK